MIFEQLPTAKVGDKVYDNHMGDSGTVIELNIDFVNPYVIVQFDGFNKIYNGFGEIDDLSFEEGAAK